MIKVLNTSIRLCHLDFGIGSKTAKAYEMILCKLFNDNDYNNGNNNDGIADDDYKSDSGDHCGYVIS